MTRSTLTFWYRVYKIMHGQWEMFDHCRQVTSSQFYFQEVIYKREVLFRHLSDVYKVLALSFKHFSVGQFLRMLSDVSFLNLRPLMLPVVQFSFAIFYPAIFHTLCLFSPYHTFIFQQTILASCLWCFFVHSSTACLLSAPPWVNSSVIILVLPLISVSCFVLFQTQSLHVFPFGGH